MLVINNLDQEKEIQRENYQDITCQDCKIKLKIAQIQRKHINQYTDFAVFVYYCQKCDLTYIIFKLVDKRK